MSRSFPFVLVALTCAVWQCATPASAQTAPISLTVDARDAARDVYHVRETLTASGPTTLVYPKWIPGEHGPDGPIENLVNLRVTAGGHELPWARDEVDLFAFRFTAPPQSTVTISFDQLSPPRGASNTPNLAWLEWNETVLYPQGATAAGTMIAPSLMAPAGWSFGTALATTDASATTAHFAPVSLETLVDSPVLMGANLKRVTLAPADGGRGLNEAVLVADAPSSLDLTADTITHLQNIVTQEDALFGARHWRTYHFLISLTNDTAHFGLEHHESSDDRLFANSLTDPDALLSSAGLLPHEYTHSWNGKYRRPAGLATPNYQVPMQDELLWVYEGLTNYWGDVLAFRSGLRSVDDYPDFIAETIASMNALPGRQTRALVDTAIGIPVARGSSGAYNGLRRGGDYYPEGGMVWMEADMLIREHTHGAKSLDDFGRLFHGGADSAPIVKPYTREDVIAALNAVDPYDWKTFFDTRIDAVRPVMSTEGLKGAGWRLAFNDKPTRFIALREKVRGGYNALYSLGASFGSDGTIADVYQGLPFAAAGLSPGSKIIALNGRRFALDALRDAVKNSPSAVGPMRLVVETAGFVREYQVDYHGGARYPHLTRIDDRTDYLKQSAMPKAVAR